MASLGNRIDPNSLANIDFILESHPKDIWNDRLSRRLRLWCEEIRAISLEDSTALQNKCKELFERILIKFNRPLKEPVLERQWVWEKKFLESYRRHWDLSPFDGKPMIEMRPHAFAEQITSWAKSYLNSRTTQTSDSLALMPASSQQLVSVPLSLEDALTVPIQNPDVLRFKLFTFLILARNDLCREVQERFGHQIEITSRSTKQLAEKTKTRLLQGEESLKQSSIENAKWVESSFQGLQSIQQGTIQIEKDQNQIKKDQNQILREQLRAAKQQAEEAEKNVQEMQASIDTLKLSNAQMAAKLN